MKVHILIFFAINAQISLTNTLETFINSLTYMKCSYFLKNKFEQWFNLT